MTLRPTTPHVPSLESVLTVLEHAEPAAAALAAAHLLTPSDVMAGAGASVDVEGGVVTWRGATVTTDGTWSEVVTRIRDMVSAERTPADRFLAVGPDPLSWVKLVRSGAFVHAAGVREVLGGPLVTFGCQVSATVASAVLRLICQGQTPVAGVLHLAGSAVRIRTGARAVHVEMVSSPARL